MNERKFIFIGGLHRSGTSLLHEIIRDHSNISGFSNTGVPEDEGQHLQTVYKAARAFGGPGKFAFSKDAYMDESHPLATTENANILFEQWSKYFDSSCQNLVEKSPPNLIRTRFLQELYPNSKFIIILRHPIAVSYATQKFSKIPIISLLEHSLHAYEVFLNDKKHLNSVYIVRYEDLILEPQKIIDNIFAYLGLDSLKIKHNIHDCVNSKYFSMWEKDKKELNQNVGEENLRLESRANSLGYSINNYNKLTPIQWLGAHIQFVNDDKC